MTTTSDESNYPITHDIVHVPFDDCVLTQLIDKQKEIIQETGISYLRIVPKEKEIEIWGNSSSCYLAKDKIYKLIFNIIDKITSNYEYVLRDLTIKWFEEKLKVLYGNL